MTTEYSVQKTKRGQARRAEQPRRSGTRLSAIVAAIALLAAACGSGSDPSVAATGSESGVAAPSVAQTSTSESAPSAEPTAAAEPDPTPVPQPTSAPQPTPVPTTEPDPGDDGADLASLFDLSMLGAPADVAVPVVADPGPEDTFGQIGATGIVDPASTIAASQAMLASMTSEQVDARFNNSSFPCGAVTAVFLVTCTHGATRIVDSEFIVVAVAFEGPVATGDGAFTYAIAFDDDGDESDNYQYVEPYDGDFFRNTEFWYSLHVAADGTRTMWADGIVDGVLGVPRFSAALVIEAGDRIYWVIPRREVPGSVVGYRATGFTERGAPGADFNPETGGGDFTGATVLDPLILIDLTPIAFGNESAVPPDMASPQARLELPLDDTTYAMQVLVQEFVDRANTFLATGDPERTIDAVLHPQMLFGPGADACRQILRDTITQADTIDLPGLPPGVIPGLMIAMYQPTGVVNYPTGTLDWQPLLAVGPQGRLFMVLPECLQ